MNDYSQVISASHYARVLPDGRIESWPDIVHRYLDYISEKYADLLAPYRAEIARQLVAMNVMPSMRALMTAGEAARRDNVCMYNCSFLPIQGLDDIVETMALLMSGTGVGFSCEEQFTRQLPVVAARSGTVLHHVVQDSKAGWVDAFRFLLENKWLAGHDTDFNYTHIRPAGTPLKTMGGLASGPEPLRTLFNRVAALLESYAPGELVRSVDVHHMVCWIGDVVVVGGVRRSALISLSDLNNEHIRDVKSGKWWDSAPWLRVANNSAVYNGKPDALTFATEWAALQESKSGERGIFNRGGMINKLKNRRSIHTFGTNPCGEICLRPYQFCNLTEVVIRATDSLKTLCHKIEIAVLLGMIQARYTHFPLLRRQWVDNCEDERLLGVSLSGICDHPVLSNPDKAAEWLRKMHTYVWKVHFEFCARFLWKSSTAITCVKPSGTVSQLADCASGIHPRYSKFYMRAIRISKRDPIALFLRQNGVPCEDDLFDATSYVFSFPIKAPAACVTRNDMSALQQLRLWLVYSRHWCDHNVSVTVQIRDNEWDEVGAFVYEHFDEIVGVSFLPYDSGTYKQAPYIEIDEATYLTVVSKVKPLPWNTFAPAVHYLRNSQFVCTGNSCESFSI